MPRVDRDVGQSIRSGVERVLVEIMALVEVVAEAQAGVV